MSDRPDLRKTNTGEKIKRKDIVATRSWTREELEVCIEDCGGVADQETVDRMAEKLKAYLSDNDILQKLAGEIEMEPASEPAASLKKTRCIPSRMQSLRTFLRRRMRSLSMTHD